MGNIIGNGFNPNIIGQINQRQNVLGIANNIPDSILRWNNANTAWVRLASSVDLIKASEDEMGDGQFAGYDSNLAKNNVLFGGTITYDGNGAILKSSNGAYSLSSFGYKPMAGITGVDISYLNNNGTLQKAVINIKAYSPEQLELLDKLYMRPGYNILLEWGHTIYLDNGGNVNEFNVFNTQPFIDIFDKTKTPQNILDGVKRETNKYFGNYGAFYGPIIKFNWKFNPDEASYDITIEAISQGHIVESLKINTSLKQSSESTANLEKDEDIPTIIAYRNASAFHNFLYDIYVLTNTEGREIAQDVAEDAAIRAIAGIDVTTGVVVAVATGNLDAAVDIVVEEVRDAFGAAAEWVGDVFGND